MNIPALVLEQLIRDCFVGLGVSGADAQAVADALLYANLRGIDSHGLERVPVYMQRVKSGLAVGSDQISWIAGHSALCRLDAHHALGPAAGVHAINLAAQIASKHGIGLVTLGNSSNFGAAGFYALRAAERDLIGIVTCNAPKMMAPHGAREVFLGSNPLAIAVPMGDGDEFVLDMSSTVVARGKLRRAAAMGHAVQPGVALDEQGHPTTDPARALTGALLPSGGPKGAGLALAIAILVSVLAGADFDDEVASIYADSSRAQNLGQLFLVIDPWSVSDREETELRLKGLVERLHALAPLTASHDVRYAGEGAARRARARLVSGIPIEVSDLKAVAKACRECELPHLAKEAEALMPFDLSKTGYE